MNKGNPVGAWRLKAKLVEADFHPVQRVGLVLGLFVVGPRSRRPCSNSLRHRWAAATSCTDMAGHKTKALIRFGKLNLKQPPRQMNSSNIPPIWATYRLWQQLWCSFEVKENWMQPLWRWKQSDKPESGRKCLLSALTRLLHTLLRLSARRPPLLMPPEGFADESMPSCVVS